MSREVDQRVVEMRFDNAQFEKNTRESMKTLDRLQEKLQFKDVDKGFENIEKAQRNVNFDEMEGALDTLKVKFNALDVMAVAALTNITNKIVDTGERLVKSLSVDQVASGWNKYTEKTSNVQTIMNATGKSVDKVNGYLNKLMWYSDETSYSFSELSSAMSSMTAAGGDIEKLIPMIIGIANSVADAGKGGEAFVHTIRNLTQSYSTGFLQLQDWNSLAIANTNSKTLVENLIEAGKELGTLDAQGRTSSGTVVDAGSFRNTLSDKWATKAVMERAFTKYAQMTLGVYDLTQEKGISASEAIDELSGSYDEIAERSFKAAQQAKSFNEAIDATKDAVSSSWMKVFETFFGNKDEAIETWSELAERLYDIFVPSIDALNERLKEGLDTGWKQLNDKLGDQAEVYDTVLQKVALASGAVTEESIKKAGGFSKALEEGGVSAELLQNGLDSTLVTLRNYLALSDKELNARNLDKEAIQKDYDALTKLNEEVQNGTVNLIDYAKGMSQVSGRQHLMQSLWNIMDAIGKVVQPIKEAFNELFPPADGDRIYSFAERLDLLTQKLIISDATAAKIKKTFKGVFSVLKVFTTALSKVGTVAKEAFGLALNAMQPVAEVLLNVSAGFGEFLNTVMQVVTGSGTLKEKLGGVKTALGKLLSPVSELGEKLKNTKIAQYIGDFIEQGENATGVLGNLYSVGKRVFWMLSVLVQGVASGGAGILGGLSMAVGTLLGKLGSLGQTISEFIGLSMPTMEEFQQSLTDMPKNLAASMSEFASGFESSMDKINGSVGDAFAPVKQFFTALKEGFDSITGTDVYRFMSLIDVGLLAVAINQVAKAMNSLKKMLQTPLTGMLDSISGTFKQLTSAIKTWQKNNASKTLVSMASAVLILAGAMYVMSRIDPDRFCSVAAVTMLSIVLLAGAAKLLEPTAKKFDKAFDSLKSSMLNAATLWGTAAALIGLGVAVGSITKGLSNLVAALNEGDIAANAAALAIAAAAVVALMLAMGELNKALVIGEKVINHKMLLSTAAEMIALGTAIKIVSTALEPLSQIKFTSLAKAGLAVVSLGGLLTSMATVLAAVQKLIGPTGFQNGAAIAAMASGIWIAAQAVSSIANIKLVNLDAAMTSIKTLMLLMTTMSALSAKTKFTSGAAIFMMSSSLIVLAGAVELFAVMGDGAIDGLIKVSAGLTALSIASQAAGADGAMAIMTMSTAMLVLAGAVAVYEKLGDGAWSAMLKCGVALAGMYVAVFALSKMSGDALQAAWTINTLSTGMIKLAAACAIFNVVNWDALKVAAVALGGLIAILFGAGWLATKLPVVSVGFTALATAFDKFASAALKLAGATAILGVLSMFAGPICQAIINAAPDIQEALISVITVLCNVIIQCAEPIALALAALGTAAIVAIVTILANLWEMIEPALNDLWDKFTDWCSKHNPFDPSNWGGTSDKMAANTEMVQKHFWQPFEDIMDELKNGNSVTAGIYQQLFDVGENASKGNAKGQLKGKDEVTNATTEVANASINAAKTAFDSHSPSRVMEEIGRYVTLGLANGIADQNALERAKSAMLNAATSIRNVFTTYWGIHSPSDLAATDAENILEGAILGMADENARERLRQESYNAASEVKTGVGQALDEATATVQTKIQGLYQAFKAGNPLTGNTVYQNGVRDAARELTDAQNNNILIPGKNGITKPGNDSKAPSTLDQISETVKNGVATLTQPIQSYLDETIDALYQKTADTVNDVTGSTGKTNKSGTTKSTKTEADKLVDEYTKKLKANKAKMDAADKEYALWELTEGDTSSVEALVEKKTESLTQAIADQTDRVAIAKEQYKKILEEKSSTDTQKSDAYATYLDEEKTLAELKGKKQATLFQVIKDRYDDEASTATDEYELWASLYEDTATVEEKSNRKIENLNKKIGIQAKVVTAAEEEYTKLKAEFGEESLKTQEAYRQWLEEQKEQQDLINEMNQAQLDAFDDALAMLEKQEKIITNRQNVLKKIYDDGDLSQREEAYKAAVKQYGADSKEAKRASTQGTMTAILGVGTALDSMAYSVKKLTNKQDKYNEAVKQSGKDSEAALDALAEWQGEQYNFVGFAEDLATAFDLDDSGKRMTMQLGYAIARNWKPIQKGFQEVWQKVQTKFPQAAQNMANAFGLVVREGATEVITDVYSMITAAVGGDWGQALTSGIAAVLDFMGSDFGKTVMDTVGPMLATAGKKLSGVLATTLGGVASEGGLLATIGTKLAGLAAAIGGEGGILATVGAKLAALAASLGPQGLLVAAVVAGGAVVLTLLVKNWDKVKNFFGKALEWLWNLGSKFVETGKNLVKGLWNGITGAAKAVGDGIKTLGTNLVNGVKSFFGIHSPSTVMAQLGEYMSLGFANGIADSGSAVDRSMNDVMRSAMTAAQMSADMILSCFDEDADFRPTITPVVDLEGVRNSANWMQSAFADPDGTLNARFEQPTQLMRSFAKRREIQNGETAAAAANGNEDVVAAIESLGNRVDAVSEAVRNMKISLDRRKLVGEIIEDVDTKLMERAERRRR